jgi:hypothetical protein
VIYKDGRENKFDILQPPCMIKVVSFESTEFGNKFVMDEVVSLIFVFMRENKGMT